MGKEINLTQKTNLPLTLLLITTSEQSTRQDTVTDLFLFLLRYPFLLNNASKTQNSRGLKTPQLNAPQGNIYMGARYLDPKYSRWISVDPALGEYVPGAGKSDEADKLPGMGGIYNSVNGNLYHYAGNNPVRYVDPDGRKTKNAKVQELINKLGENPKSLISKDLTIVNDLEDAGWTFIGNDAEEICATALDLKSLAKDDGTMVNSFTKTKSITSIITKEKNITESFSNAKEVYKSRAIGAKPSIITERNSSPATEEQKISTYEMQIYTATKIDPETGKEGKISQSFIDINNDGNIDFKTWGYNEIYDEN